MMTGLVEIPREADSLRDRTYAVRPAGQLGTCGFYPVPWTVQYVKANSPEDALEKTKKIFKVVDQSASD